MSKHESVLRFAIGSVLALSGAAFATSAVAADSDKEQCAGIIKAGKNDCATRTCAGTCTSPHLAASGFSIPRANTWARSRRRSPCTTLPGAAPTARPFTFARAARSIEFRFSSKECAHEPPAAGFHGRRSG